MNLPMAVCISAILGGAAGAYTGYFLARAQESYMQLKQLERMEDSMRKERPDAADVAEERPQK